MADLHGLAPGPFREGAELHCIEFREGKRHGLISDLDAISDAIATSGTLVWLDVVDPSREELALLQREFDLHPLAIEDAQTPHERPKIESFDLYALLIVHPVTWEGERLVIHELAIFAGHRFLLTIHRSPAYSMTEVDQRWHIHDGELGGDSGFLLYTLLDTIVDGYFPIADRLEEWINELQADVFNDRSDVENKLRDIFELKRDVHGARRAVTPMRDILQPILRGDYSFLARDELPYYRDVHDHAIRVIDSLDSMRDLLNSAMEILLSLQANRQNEVSKQLAVIATIFLPLSFITGFFGQNFDFMIKSIGTPTRFWVLGVGTQVVGLVILLAYFRIKRWF